MLSANRRLLCDHNMRSVTGGFEAWRRLQFRKYTAITGAFKNTMTNAQYRGGAAEPVYYLENIIDVAARELEIDPAEPTN